MVGLRAGSPVDAPTSAQQQLCLLPLLCVPSTPPSKIPIQGKGAHGTALHWIGLKSLFMIVQVAAMHGCISLSLF
jgi:hypothetical protein